MTSDAHNPNTTFEAIVRNLNEKDEHWKYKFIDSLAVCYCIRDYCNGADGIGGGIGFIIGLLFPPLSMFTANMY